MHRFHILHIFRDYFCNFEINGYFLLFYFYFIFIYFFFFFGGGGAGDCGGGDIGRFYKWNRIISYNLFLFSLKYHPKA